VRIRPVDRTAKVALGIALGWSTLVLVGGFLVPVYSWESVSEDVAAGTGPVTTSGTATLVAVNGIWVVALLAIPLVASLAVAAAVLLGRTRAARVMAWTLTGLLAGFTVLGLMSIGIVVLPVTVALLVACVSTMPARAVPLPIPASPAL